MTGGGKLGTGRDIATFDSRRFAGTRAPGQLQYIDRRGLEGAQLSIDRSD